MNSPFNAQTKKRNIQLKEKQKLWMARSSQQYLTSVTLQVKNHQTWTFFPVKQGIYVVQC